MRGTSLYIADRSEGNMMIGEGYIADRSEGQLYIADGREGYMGYIADRRSEGYINCL